MPPTGLLKTSFLTGISTGIRLVALFFINKIIAVVIGPSGLALTGQFMNFSTFATTFSNGGISSGIVKYVAEKGGDELELQRVLRSSFLISIFASILLSSGIILFRSKLAVLLLGGSEFKIAFLVLGLSLVFIAFYNGLVSVVNGFKDVRTYVAINITASILGLVCVIFFIYFYKLTGSLLAVSLSQAVSLLGAVFFVRKMGWFNWSMFSLRIDPETVKGLLKYSAMMAVASVTAPLAQICVRSYIAGELGIDSAGMWEGVWRISEAYLMLITASLSVYYLPRLSEIQCQEELRSEIISGYKIIIPIVIVAALIIYLGRGIIVTVLFTEEFSGMEGLFGFQLLGDVIKIGSWLLSFLMLAKTMIKTFIITEVLFSALFVMFSILMVKNFGLAGSTMAFALNYFIYFLTMLYIFRDLLFKRFA